MYVMTEDGKWILDATDFSVERNIGGKKGKFVIIAHVRSQTLSQPILSYWPDEEAAKVELQRIWKALTAGETYLPNKSI